MNILNVTEAPGWSGGTNQMLLTARELSARGHRVVMACPEGSVLAGRASSAGLEVRALRIRQDYDLPSAWRLSRIIRETGSSILHAHHPRAHAVSIVARALNPRVRLAVTRRVIFPIRRNPFSALKYRSGFIDRYIAVCRAAAGELMKAGVAEDRIRVIPSAVDLPRWDAVSAGRGPFPAAGPHRIGLVGHYAPFKGHQVLLKAAPAVLREFPSTRFVLAGRGTESLASLVRELGLSGSVDILGQRDDIPEILSSLHLFVMPSLQEGIATALMEAQASGLPAVASRVGGIPDVLVDGETGLLVEPDDPRALAEAILRSLKDPQGSMAMAARGRERVKSLFALPAVASRLEGLYQELAS